MKRLIEHQSAWLGGYYEVGGRRFHTSSRPPATLIIEGKPHRAVYQKVSGIDYDHGHEYHWAITDIGIMDGNLVPRFFSVKALLKAGKSVMIDLEERP